MKTNNPSQLADILRDLVAIQTVEDKIPCKFEIINYVADRLRSNKLIIRTGSSGGLPWLVATTQSNTNPRVLLQAHLDVVPANDESFMMHELNNRYFGRGVFDMKFAVACYLLLVSNLGDSINKYDFGIMLTTDEEIGGENGVGYLLEQGYGGDICILPDGGDNWVLESQCNGVWLVEVIAHGKTAHGSRPWEGDNAIVKLLDCVSKIQRIFPMNNHDKNTLTISKIQGGKAMNQVPSEARVTLDMRFIDQKAYSEKRIEIESCVQKSGLELETIARVDSIEADTTQPEISKFMEIAQKVRGKPIECGRSYGASDAHYFTRRGIPTIVMRPEGGGAHSDSEWIDKTGLYMFYEVIRTYVREQARVA